MLKGIRYGKKREKSPDSTEKSLNVAKSSQSLQRDEWMLKPSPSLRVSPEPKKQPEQEPIDEQPKGNFIDASDEIEKDITAESFMVGDGGARWRQKALKHARERAIESDISVDDSVSERFSSVADLEKNDRPGRRGRERDRMRNTGSGMRGPPKGRDIGWRRKRRRSRTRSGSPRNSRSSRHDCSPERGAKQRRNERDRTNERGSRTNERGRTNTRDRTNERDRTYERNRMNERDRTNERGRTDERGSGTNERGITNTRDRTNERRRTNERDRTNEPGRSKKGNGRNNLGDDAFSGKRKKVPN
eukprot:340291_1